MDQAYTIGYAAEPPWAIIGPAINEYNRRQAGDDHGQSLCFVLKGLDEEVAGGVIGATHWDWFQLDLIWVREDLRGRGYGHRLLTLAEGEARRRGARHVHLDTFSFPGARILSETWLPGFWAVGRLPGRAPTLLPGQAAVGS